ncbi:LysR substrate-binding domain-containing protein [Acinetobacter pseudolwoffii]|uniref:LysR substrate-binding domain-containing protein n=1 Tax=Acinetobacter pseudolwoffii TaxID=2053287 RepID=UPI00398A26EC
MNAMSPRFYPSITALRCFVAAAKYLSFTKAAHVLNMTQSAVSKQILHLEETLNFPLFERTAVGLSLSPQAMDFFKQSESILNQIELSVYQLSTQRTEQSTLNIVAHPSLCTRWLLPELQHFKKHHQHIRINITEQVDSLEIHTPYVDAAFLYGTGTWNNKQTIKLFDEECIAVASPSITNRSFVTLDEFQNHDLIHVQARMNAWHDYFNLQKKALEISDSQGIFLDSFNACIQAAILGYGIALVPKFFVIKELESKQLIQVWNFSMPTQQSYYLCFEKNMGLNSPTQELVTWFTPQLEYKTA